MLRAHATITLVVSTTRTTLHALTARLATSRAHIVDHLLFRHITILCSPAGSPTRGTARFLVRGQRVGVLGGNGSVRRHVDDGGHDGRRLRRFFSL
jgi:hypothetical protein